MASMWRGYEVEDKLAFEPIEMSLQSAIRWFNVQSRLHHAYLKLYEWRKFYKCTYFLDCCQFAVSGESYC